MSLNRETALEALHHIVVCLACGGAQLLQPTQPRERPMCTFCNKRRATWLWHPGWKGGYCSRACFNADDPLCRPGRKLEHKFDELKRKALGE